MSLPSEPYREADAEAARRVYLIDNLASRGLRAMQIASELGMTKGAVQRKLRRRKREAGRERAAVEAYREWCWRATQEIPRYVLRRRSYQAARRVRAYGGEVAGHVDLFAVILRDRALCHICGDPVEPDALAFDHVIPLVRGGRHEIGNVKLAHSRCNGTKGARL